MKFSIASKKTTLLRKTAAALFVLALCFAAFMTCAYAKDYTAASVSGKNITFSDISLPDNDNLFKGYVQKTLYPQDENGIEPSSDEAGKLLTGAEKEIYDILKEKITDVANGRLESTVFSIDKAALNSMGITTDYTAAELGLEKNNGETDKEFANRVANAAFDKVCESFDSGRVMFSLIYDSPYELYWFDKTKGMGTSGSISLIGGKTFSVAPLYFYFNVANDYMPEVYDSNSPTVDTSKTGAATAAAENAKKIVEKYKALPDYQKLKAYRDVICALTSYNSSAADSSQNVSYGDPWQIIYVFDGNDETNVVCEGYSKAFQYLADLSEFSGKVKCCTVTGVTKSGTGAGNHMWNIVTMEDGKNYLVDITNSDTGTIGQNGELFLAGADGSISSGYKFSFDSLNYITYTYSDKSMVIWGTDYSSPLHLRTIGYQYENGVEALGAFNEDINIEKVYGGAERVTLKITPKTGKSVPSVKVITAIFDENKNICNAFITSYNSSSSKTEITLSKPDITDNKSYKIFVWSQNASPVIRTISDLKAF